MRYLVLALLSLWAAAAAAYEETVDIPGSPELRAAISPRDGAETYGYVTGQFVLRLQLVSAFRFEALDFRLPEIADAKVITVLKPKTIEINTYAGSGFIFETSISIFPTKAGTLVIPPVIAEGIIEPTPGERTPFRSETLETRIEIRDPPASFTGDWWLVSSRVEVEENWSAPPEEAHPGDILRREVTVTAYGLEGERLPTLTLEGMEGASVSDLGGSAKTLRSSDGVIGKAERAWDIRIDDPRLAKIGPVRIEHWHPSYHRMVAVEAPGLTLEPMPPDPEAAAEALLAEDDAARRVNIAAAAALGALIAGPALALFIAWIWAMAPTAADRRLSAGLKRAAAAPDAWRAMERWSAETGLPVGAADAAGRDLAAALFGAGGAGAADLGKIRSALLSASRASRVQALRARLASWVSRVFGETRSLGAR